MPRFHREEEWLIAEWPEGQEEPTDYWISKLPADTEPKPLARLARMRWKMELDDKQLKGDLGLDHYEGPSWLGWYHHTALMTAAHGFLTLERAEPSSPAAGLTLPKVVLLMPPIFKCWTGRCQTVNSRSISTTSPCTQPHTPSDSPNKALLVMADGHCERCLKAVCDGGRRKHSVGMPDAFRPPFECVITPSCNHCPCDRGGLVILEQLGMFVDVFRCTVGWTHHNG